MGRADIVLSMRMLRAMEEHTDMAVGIRILRNMERAAVAVGMRILRAMEHVAIAVGMQMLRNMERAAIPMSKQLLRGIEHSAMTGMTAAYDRRGGTRTHVYTRMTHNARRAMRIQENTGGAVK